MTGLRWTQDQLDAHQRAGLAKVATKVVKYRNQKTPAKAPVATPLVDLCRVAGLPAPSCEHRFHPVRKWRFDYAWPDRLVAVEIEGGAFSNGAHTRGAHFRSDCEKYNAAAMLGWRVFRYLPEQLKRAVGDLQGILA